MNAYSRYEYFKSSRIKGGETRGTEIRGNAGWPNERIKALDLLLFLISTRERYREERLCYGVKD